MNWRVKMNFDLANSDGNGFIKLWYALKDWEWADDPNTLSLWIHLLMEANWKDKEWKGHTIKRGQLVFGRSAWSKKTGLSERQLRTCINNLKTTNNIAVKTTNKFSILTIVNYEKFQGKPEEATSKTTSQTSDERPHLKTVQKVRLFRLFRLFRQ
jgi:hypothetical protein